MLYLPTSDAIKFKAKGWIDVFGSRCAKGVGSFVTLSSRGDRRRLATYGGVASFLIRFGRDRAWFLVGLEPFLLCGCFCGHTRTAHVSQSLCSVGIPYRWRISLWIVLLPFACSALLGPIQRKSTPIFDEESPPATANANS